MTTLGVALGLGFVVIYLIAGRMLSIEQFKKRLIIKFKDDLESMVPPVDNVEFAIYETVESVIKTIEEQK